MRVFVAGASGAIGEPLIAELLKQRHSVVGMTASEARARNLEIQGAEAVTVDAFDKGGGISSFVHINDAAIATVAVLTAEPGVYNLVDDDPSPQAIWLPSFAKSVGAPEPPHKTEAEVKAIAGEDAVYYATKLSGASNAKAKRILGWKPRQLEWFKM